PGSASRRSVSLDVLMNDPGRLVGVLAIPPHLLGLRYDGRVHPGAAPDLDNGANCQVFAYELLAHHSLAAPRLRSRELWQDVRDTIEVTSYQPLALLLFHASPEAFGAHVTVYVGDGHVAHLARHHGRPVIESIDQLRSQPRYRCFIGAKRVLRTK